MSKLNLLFKSLTVSKARGIRRKGGFCCDGLAQINIIYGCNGIGKSTAGLALMTLLVLPGVNSERIAMFPALLSSDRKGTIYLLMVKLARRFRDRKKIPTLDLVVRTN